MSNLISRGMALISRVLSDPIHGTGVQITYMRGGQISVITAGWVGRTAFKQVDAGQGGAALIWGDRDYLIPVSDFPAWSPATPQRGDRIIELIGGVATTFELHAPGQEPCWRYSDPDRTIFRAHVKRVGAKA